MRLHDLWNPSAEWRKVGRSWVRRSSANGEGCSDWPYMLMLILMLMFMDGYYCRRISRMIACALEENRTEQERRRSKLGRRSSSLTASIIPLERRWFCSPLILHGARTGELPTRSSWEILATLQLTSSLNREKSSFIQGNKAGMEPPQSSRSSGIQYVTFRVCDVLAIK